MSNSKKNAYIVKDTKTYVYAEEAKFKLARKNDLNILFVVIPRIINNRLKERMEEIVSKNEWDEINWVLTRSNGTSFLEMKNKKKKKWIKSAVRIIEYFYNFLDRVRMDRLARKYSPCGFVVSSHKNTQEHLASALKPERLILVDSGHRVFERINKSGFIDYSAKIMSRSRMDRILYRLSGLRVFDRDKTELFTIYADKIKTRHKIIKNDFDHQRHLFRSKNVGNEAVWISTPIYTMAKGITIDDYIDYIKASVDELKIRSENLTYIPHPGKQTNTEINHIQKRLSCKIDSRDLPVESKVAMYDDLPAICISPFSSALVNIYKASEGRISLISAWHSEFSLFRVWADWRQSVEENSDLDIRFFDVESHVSLFKIKLENDIKKPIYENFQEWERTNV